MFNYSYLQCCYFHNVRYWYNLCCIYPILNTISTFHFSRGFFVNFLLIIHIFSTRIHIIHCQKNSRKSTMSLKSFSCNFRPTFPLIIKCGFSDTTAHQLSFSTKPWKLFRLIGSTDWQAKIIIIKRFIIIMIHTPKYNLNYSFMRDTIRICAGSYHFALDTNYPIIWKSHDVTTV